MSYPHQDTIDCVCDNCVERRQTHCLTCGKPLTADDPVVTTLGPRCREHF